MCKLPLDDAIALSPCQIRPNMTIVILRVGSAMTGHISSKRARYLNRTSLSRPRFDTLFDTPNLVP